MNAVVRRLRRARNLANKVLVQVQNDYLRWTRVLGRPFQLTLEPGNVCNLKCPLCATTHRESKIPKGRLHVEEARRIMDAFPYTVQLVLSNWGEPFMNPDLFDIIVEAKKRDMKVRMESNMTLFDDEKAKRLVDSGLDLLVVALDGASQETYEKYRVGGDFQTIIDNIGRIRAAQQAAGNFKTKLLWKMVINRHNEHELEKARAWAAELGMDFETVTIWAPEGEEKEWLPDSALDHHGRRNEGGQPEKCHNLWQTVSVNFNGDVFPCCSEFTPEDKVVNVLESPFGPVWNSAEYRERRAQNKGPVDCTRCHKDKDTNWYRTWMKNGGDSGAWEADGAEGAGGKAS